MQDAGEATTTTFSCLSKLSFVATWENADSNITRIPNMGGCTRG
jgi:hypothetical protein